MNPKSLPSTTTFTPVPDPLLGDVLQSIDSLAELKCILRALWHIHRKKGALRCVTLAELRADPVLQGELDEDEITDAMNGGARRGIFARASVATERGRTDPICPEPGGPTRRLTKRAVAGTLTLPQGDEDSTAEPPSTKKRPQRIRPLRARNRYDYPAGCRRVEVGGGGLSPGVDRDRYPRSGSQRQEKLALRSGHPQTLGEGRQDRWKVWEKF